MNNRLFSKRLTIDVNEVSIQHNTPKTSPATLPKSIRLARYGVIPLTPLGQSSLNPVRVEPKEVQVKTSRCCVIM